MFFYPECVGFMYLIIKYYLNPKYIAVYKSLYVVTAFVFLGFSPYFFKLMI